MVFEGCWEGWLGFGFYRDEEFELVVKRTFSWSEVFRTSQIRSRR